MNRNQPGSPNYLDRGILRILQCTTILSPETWILGMLLMLLCAHLMAWISELPAQTMAHLGALTGVANLCCTLVIVRAQRALTAALQLKLDALIAAADGAGNDLVAIEDADEATLERQRARLLGRVQRAGPTEPVSTDTRADAQQPASS